MSNTSKAANGVPKRSRKKGSEESQDSLGPFDFGKLTGRLEPEIDKLRRASDAIPAIANIFHEYRSDIEVFESKFEAIQHKDKEIRDLSAAIRGWKSTRDEEVDTLKAELQSMAEQHTRLQEERGQFERIRNEETQELETRWLQVQKMEGQLKEENEKKLKKLKDILREESRETMTQLQASNEGLNKEVASLTADLKEARENAAKEKGDWWIVRSALDGQIKNLHKELESMKNEFALEARSDNFYEQKFSEIQVAIKEASSRFFSGLPRNPVSKRRTFESLNKPCEVVEFAFLPETPVSISLRLVAVEYLIADTLCGLIWQPFAPGIPPSEVATITHLEAISRELAKRESCTESTWRALTVNVLRTPSAERSMLDDAVGRMFELLTPFTDEPGDKQLFEALADIVHKAMDVWEISQRDVSKVVIHNAPDSGDSDGWMHEDGDLFGDSHDKVDLDTTAVSSMSPICIFPKILRLPPRAGPLPTTIFRGRALFDNSRLLLLGRKESLDLQKVMTDAHKQFVSQRGGESGLRIRSDRRSSVAAQMACPNTKP